MPDMCDLAKFLKKHDFAAIFYSNIRLAALHYAASYGNNYLGRHRASADMAAYRYRSEIVAVQTIIVKVPSKNRKYGVCEPALALLEMDPSQIAGLPAR